MTLWHKRAGVSNVSISDFIPDLIIFPAFPYSAGYLGVKARQVAGGRWLLIVGQRKSHGLPLPPLLRDYNTVQYRTINDP